MQIKFTSKILTEMILFCYFAILCCHWQHLQLLFIMKNDSNLKWQIQPFLLQYKQALRWLNRDCKMLCICTLFVKKSTTLGQFRSNFGGLRTLTMIVNSLLLMTFCSFLWIKSRTKGSVYLCKSYGPLMSMVTSGVNNRIFHFR